MLMLHVAILTTEHAEKMWFGLLQSAVVMVNKAREAEVALT